MRAKPCSGLSTILLVLLTTSAVRAQSLADVARKEEERRKHEPTAAKVYTNKDLGAVEPAPLSSAPVPTLETGASGAKDDKDAAKKGDGEKGEAKGQAYWSSRRKGLQETLNRDSTYLDAMQSRINALTTDFVNRDDPIQRSKIASDRDKALAELERLKKQVTLDQKAIGDLEEEARRAGVPAGWLR